MPSIRIVAVPPGEAPLEVREAWMGLELPLPRWKTRPRRFPTFGVLSGPQDFFRRLAGLLTFRFTMPTGYVVGVLPAIDVLERSHPWAATWWRVNTPHLMRRSRHFLFPVECCEFIK
jgi:hypothetical protein